MFNKTKILSITLTIILLVVCTIVAIESKSDNTTSTSSIQPPEDFESITPITPPIKPMETTTNSIDSVPVDNSNSNFSIFIKYLNDISNSDEISSFVTDVDIFSSESQIIFSADSTITYEDFYNFIKEEYAAGYGDDEPILYDSCLYDNTSNPVFLLRFSSSDACPEENCAIAALKLVDGQFHITCFENSLNTEYASINILKNNIWMSRYHPTTNITNSSYNYINTDGIATEIYEELYAGYYNIPLLDKYTDAFDAADINDYDYLDTYLIEFYIHDEEFIVLNYGNTETDDTILFQTECEKRGISFSNKDTVDTMLNFEFQKYGLTYSAINEETVEWTSTVSN